MLEESSDDPRWRMQQPKWVMTRYPLWLLLSVQPVYFRKTRSRRLRKWQRIATETRETRASLTSRPTREGGEVRQGCEDTWGLGFYGCSGYCSRYGPFR